jgi:hypothetical protein
MGRYTHSSPSERFPHIPLLKRSLICPFEFTDSPIHFSVPSTYICALPITNRTSPRLGKERPGLPQILSHTWAEMSTPRPARIKAEKNARVSFEWLQHSLHHQANRKLQPINRETALKLEIYDIRTLETNRYASPKSQKFRRKITAFTTHDTANRPQARFTSHKPFPKSVSSQTRRSRSKSCEARIPKCPHRKNLCCNFMYELTA